MAEEESALLFFLVYMANRGYPLTRTLTKAFAMGITIRSGSEGRLGEMRVRVNTGGLGSDSVIPKLPKEA